jgi:hypothetical protein
VQRLAALRGHQRKLGEHMFRLLRMTAAVLVTAAYVSVSLELGPAEAACTATHSATTKAEAAQSSRALAVQSAYQLKSTRRWSCHVKCAKGQKAIRFGKRFDQTAYHAMPSSSLILLRPTSTRPALLVWSYPTSARPALLFAADSYYWRSADGQVETELFRFSWRARRTCEAGPIDGRYPIRG